MVFSMLLCFLGHCQGVARWLLKCSVQCCMVAGCSEWLLGYCFAVAKVFWVVARVLLGGFLF